MQAVDLFEQGVIPAEIARQVGVSHQIVSDWRKAWRQGGRDALRSAGPAGRKPKLSADQLAQLAAALTQGAAAHWLPNRPMDLGAGGQRDRAGKRGALPPWARVVPRAQPVELVPSTARATGYRA